MLEYDEDIYPIRKTMQFAITAAVVSSTLLLKSHQPYDKGRDRSSKYSTWEQV